jgi:hypothetical protein
MGLDHGSDGDRAEYVRVKDFLNWLGRPATDLSKGVPDWSYTFEGERWFVEITSASARPADHGRAYRRRLEADLESWTVPSSSAATALGVPFENEVVSADLLIPPILDAIRKKGSASKRYGNASRTHLVIDASGDRVAGDAAIAVIVGSVSLPADYPYVGVFVHFAVDGWARTFASLGD